jgi:hypothetical protein
MKTQYPKQLSPLFPNLVSVALSQLKTRLQRDYQKAYPGSGEIIHRVLDQEEARARQLSFFPHLILPDLVEVHFAELGFQPTKTSPDKVALSQPFTTAEPSNSAFALCG